MAKQRNDDPVSHDGDGRQKRPLKNLGISCMLNTEASAVLAVIRRSAEEAAIVSGEGELIPGDADLLNPLRDLRSIVFQPGAPNWIFMEPIIYLEPFLNVIQNCVPAAATGVALSSILKILKLGIFDETTPGAGEAVHTVASGATKCRLEKTDPTAEDAILMRILQVMTALLKHKAAILLSDCAVCTLVYNCFEIVRESAERGPLLQRTARYAVHELVQTIFSRLPEVEQEDCNSNSGNDEEEEEDDEKEEDEEEDEEEEEERETGYGVKCMVNIFQFLCSLLSVTEVREEGYGSSGSEEEMQLFALILINSSVELGGEFFGHHPNLLNIIQDDLFYHLVYHGARCSPLLLSMICSTVLNLYNFLRGSLRLQMEAFFSYVLQRKATENIGTHLQEIAVEGIIAFCRQPSFAIEMYVNYDCDPMRKDIFEETVRCLCRAAFPASYPLSAMQFQAFQGLVAVVKTIAENITGFEGNNQEEVNKPIVISEFKPFWMERSEEIRDDLEAWVDFVRLRKFKKRKVLMAANHFNRDEKKGLEFLKISRLVPDTPDPQSIAFFFRYTPGLDKNKIGDYLGDPDEFNLKVLKEFALTFHFHGVILDTALRTFLETFRLPGESQKIQRILEAFSERFYEQQSSDLFVSMDAVFILCYSLIMLNTDQHNPQVKKKMTEEEFIRNNRDINGGKSLPRDYLSELFQSISNNAITLFAQSGSPPEMTRSRWIELLGRSKVQEPFIVCEFNRKLCRDAFAAIAGPSTATLSAVFEHLADEDELNHCVDGFFFIAQISQHGLQDIIDEIILSLGKFISLLNTYVAADETLYAFTADVRCRVATRALFSLANRFGSSVRGGWSSILDCLLKLKKLKLLPQPLIESEKSADSPAFSRASSHTKSESAVFFSSSAAARSGGSKQGGLMGRFTQFLSLDDGAESLAEACGEFEISLKVVQRCQIGKIFSESSKLPVEALLILGRTLILTAGGKGHNFTTAVDEEETVGVCWDLIVAVSLANIDRFTAFWPQFHETFIAVTQLHEFSICPFSEKAIVGIFAVCLKLFSRSSPPDKASEELIFKSVNFIWKLDKVIIESCSVSIAESVARLLMEHRGAIQTLIGWKTVLQLLAITGRHQETYSRCVEALMALMVEEKLISRANYGFCVEAALGFAASKNTRLEESMKIIDLMVGSVRRLIQWQKSGSGEKYVSISAEDGGKTGGNVEVSLFLKLVEALKKIGLAKREEVRNHAAAALRRCFTVAAAELEFTPASSMACFNNAVSMVDDLQEKMIEHSKSKGPEREREMRSMEGTLREALELSAEGMMLFLKSLHQNPSFRQLWLGFLRRMDTCVKGEVGQLRDLVPELLKKVIVEMKKKEILVQRPGDELWEITNIQIQWIAPSLKDELFPEEV